MNRKKQKAVVNRQVQNSSLADIVLFFLFYLYLNPHRHEISSLETPTLANNASRQSINKLTISNTKETRSAPKLYKMVLQPAQSLQSFCTYQAHKRIRFKHHLLLGIILGLSARKAQKCHRAPQARFNDSADLGAHGSHYASEKAANEKRRTREKNSKC